ncbi:hypothetical protein D3C75_197650 [compost metagenome]
MSGADKLQQDLLQEDLLQEDLMREELMQKEPVRDELMRDDPAGTAALCSSFQPDLEEEWADDEETSCLNCYFRRWTSRSFDCMAPERGGFRNV